jgi:hypothetical protein
MAMFCEDAGTVMQWHFVAREGHEPAAKRLVKRMKRRPAQFYRIGLGH